MAPFTPVSVVFDDLIFALQRFGGASVYWREVTSRVTADPRCTVTRGSPARWKRGLPALCRREIFHSSHFRAAALGGARNVSTVHDLNYELGLVKGGVGARFNLWERRHSYFTADALICISQHTRKDLLDVYPRLAGRCPIHVIHHGVSRPATVGDVPPALADRPFVLYVGSRRGYKDFASALEGFHRSGVWRDSVSLVCTGEPFGADELVRISALGLASRVSVVERCTTETLFALYGRAHCLLYTSTYEGFGLPPVEAMSCGCPVVATDASSIPEITGDAAVLVPPRSPDDVARAILAVQDPGLRATLRERGLGRARRFTWDESARRHVDVYVETARGADGPVRGS